MQTEIDAARAQMVSGAWYNCLEPVYDVMRAAARRAVFAHLVCDPDVRGACVPELRQLFADFGPNARIEAPFHCSYGINISFGEQVYLNAGCVILDSAPVTIGARSMLGPGVHVYTADHHPDVGLRGQGVERGLPVSIGCDVWIGGAAVLLPGAVIGDGAIIGAGAVVRGAVAAGERVAGVPARRI